VAKTIDQIFLEKCVSDEVVVGIFGLGYVGLPLAEAFVRNNIQVIGYDVSVKRIEELEAGKSGMNHIDDQRVVDMLASGKFKATSDPSLMSDADAILLCVPTPLDKYHHPDLSYVKQTCHTLKKTLRRGQLIVLESTTYPGTTEDVIKPILEETGLKANEDFALAYSPEREDPGNIDFETTSIPKLVGADNDAEREMALAVYDKIVETVSVASTRVAEAAKLTENIFRWVNIAMANELKVIFDAMGIDVWEVIDAAKSKPFGYMAFYPGPGVGGHCIRIDPYYLTWKAREHDLSTRLIELAGEINIAMPKRVVSRLMEELNLRHQKALASCRILLCGLSYKKDIGDMRESPSTEVLVIMQEHGATVDYYDPYVPVVPHLHEAPELEGKVSIEWSAENLSKYDAVVITTDHTDVDYELLVKTVPLVLDTRNVTKSLSEELRQKTAKA